jgi:biopolymer transport protein ExbB/TolQ
MNYSVLQIYKLGWPILTVLLLCSILTLAIAFQCWSVMRRARRMSRYTGASKEALQEDLDLVDSRLAVLGTIANAAPFIGLLGTVIGIIRAFQSISASMGGGITAVAGGIAEALVSTAFGLGVAIPASVLYNYFSHRSQRLAKDLGIA